MLLILGSIWWERSDGMLLCNEEQTMQHKNYPNRQQGWGRNFHWKWWWKTISCGGRYLNILSSSLKFSLVFASFFCCLLLFLCYTIFSLTSYRYPSDIAIRNFFINVTVSVGNVAGKYILIQLISLMDLLKMTRTLPTYEIMKVMPD